MSGQTQAAHANWGIYGKGMGQKAHDCFVAALCIRCHAELDQGKNLSADERQQMWESAFRKTLVALFEQGKIKCQ
jgi:beta-glucanase (GH16 family)